MHLTGRVYDVVKYIAQIVLPAIGTLYFGLAGYWHFPNPDEVVGSIVVIDTFLGVVLGISSASYAKTAKYIGDINVSVDAEGKKTYSLDVGGDLDELDKKSEVTFKVNKA